ncbi:hypothetical protein [Amycolatopsis echigonensis]|uniref:Uncharacterized protein n=1 Tax=Amycolatopsis echigonensis TaxID=2576905 RepID=A0A2N3WGW1_9PSEU|nr:MULTISPECIES: hypothetical protein [Amycolatopsis]MBB2503093.1 hypothetical protein [Amycolatopsis echigonensis]PKV93113.1 hypothetical protein ATK30_3952 [Amycolatopsis niigatensis]
MKRPDLVLALVVAAGLLGSPFYNTELVRSQLIGGAPVGALGSVLVLCTGLALAWRATLRRGYVGGYLALLPFTAPVAQLHRVPGLRRWLDASNLRLHVVTCAFLCLLALIWAGVVLLLGIPASISAVVAVLLAALAAVRSVTRGPLDFSSMGMVLYEGVLIPAGLVRQLVRGPDLLVLGLIAASFLPVWL